jgi:YHS domain-containing protein
MKLFAFVAASTLLATGVWAQQPTAPAPNISHVAGSVAPILCAITGETIKDTASAAGKAEFIGKTYYFCCPGCVTKFNKADDATKAKFARLTELRTARIALERSMEAINGEIATLEGKPASARGAKLTGEHASLEAKPVLAKANTAKVVYCAVTGEEIGSPDKAAATVKHNNKDYYLCCPGCQVKWDKNPAKYAAEADKRQK